MAAQKKGDNFLIQGSILAIAGIIVRLIGILYRIPLINTIGEAAMGVYSTAFSVYNIMLLISSYSLPLAVSRLMAIRMEKKQYRNAKRLFGGALILALISGSVIFCAAFFGAGFFSRLLGMPETVLSIRFLSPTLFIMAFLGVFRGFFQGHQTMIPTAISQIIEQIVNAAVSLIAGYLMFTAGAAMDVSLGLPVDVNAAGYGSAGVTIGTGAGAFSALLFCIFVYFIYRPRFEKKVLRDPHTSLERYSFVMKVIILTVVPVLISTAVYQISTVLDQILYAKYVGQDYKALWGAYNGKYMLLTHVPTAIAAAMGSAIVPSLAAAIQRKDRRDVRKKAAMAVQVNMMIAIPSAVGFAVLARPIMELLFSGMMLEADVMMLTGSSVIVFTALSTVTNSILQGIGNIWIPVRNATISLGIHLVLLAVFLWGFDMGIYGVIVSTIVFYILMCVLNNVMLARLLDYRQEFVRTFVVPLIASAVMGAAAYFANRLLADLIHPKIACILAILVAVAVYFAMLMAGGKPLVRALRGSRR